MSEVSSEAMEAARWALIDHRTKWVGDWPGGTTCERCGPVETGTEGHMAEAALTAALPYLAAHQPARAVPSAEEVADELEYRVRTAAALAKGGNSIDSEVKSGRERVLALLASRPSAEEVAQIKAERDAAQEHLRYHLADFRPLADGNMSGDLAVDMAAYASRVKAELEEARAALASQPTVAEVREQVAREVEAAAEALHDIDCGCKDGPDSAYRKQATAALTAALPYLAAHQPARAVPSAEEAIETFADALAGHEWIDGLDGSCACGEQTLTFFAWRYHVAEVLSSARTETREAK